MSTPTLVNASDGLGRFEARTNVTTDDTKMKAGNSRNRQESRMTTGSPKRGAPRLKSKREKIEYYVIFAASFAFFLMAAVLSQLMRLSGMAAEQAGERSHSILKQAWSAADTTTSYAFMG